MDELWTMKPIGTLKSIFQSKNGTPRQSGLCSNARGSVTIDKSVFNNPQHSLEGLEQFSHVWLIFLFHKNNNVHTKAKVKPPRLNGHRTGVFSTRSPYRPNAIGLTLAKLCTIEDATLHLSGIDMIEGTPILDIKPYIPYCDMPVPSDTSPLDKNHCNESDIHSTDPLISVSDNNSEESSQHTDSMNTITGSSHLDVCSSPKDKSSLSPSASFSDNQQFEDCSSKLHKKSIDDLLKKELQSRPDVPVLYSESTSKERIDSDGCTISHNSVESSDHLESVEEKSLKLSDECLESTSGSRQKTDRHSLQSKDESESDDRTSAEIKSGLGPRTQSNSLDFKDKSELMDRDCTLSGCLAENDKPSYKLTSSLDSLTKHENKVLPDLNISILASKDSACDPEGKDLDKMVELSDEKSNTFNSLYSETYRESQFASCSKSCTENKPHFKNISKLDASEISIKTTNDVTTANWINDPVVSKLDVHFTNFAEDQLAHFSSASKDDKFRLKHLKHSEDLQCAITGVLQEDPRSVYRRKQCPDSLYYFTVDCAHITCWFDDNRVEVVRVKPKVLVPYCS